MEGPTATTQSACSPPALNSAADIDEELYSRQLYVMGHDAMRRLMQARVLIIGLDGLGQEIAKNICLAGVRHVGLFDKSPVSERDLGAGFYFTRSAVGTAKDAAAHAHLARLNKHVRVEVADSVVLTDWNVVIAVNQLLSDCVQMNSIAHAAGVCFIAANVAGLFSQLFTDFCEHECVDRDGQPLSSGTVNDVTPDGVLSLADGSRHSLSSGDTIRLTDASGASNVYTVTVLSRTQLRLEGYAAADIRMGGDFEQVKTPTTISFLPLSEAATADRILVFHDEARAQALHRLFLQDLVPEVKEAAGAEAQHAALAGAFAQMRGVLIAPMCSVVGGFAAQEAMKAITGRFMPLHQFMYFDCADAVIKAGCGVSSAEAAADTTVPARYADMAALFGPAGFKRLQRLNIFLVGAGAIGCEDIKNLVMCGIGSAGSVRIADMDSIEPSNLNRQFLFHEDNIGQPKSEAAAARAAALNEDYARPGAITAHNAPLAAHTEDVFSDELLAGTDAVVNALDSVEARNYMDARCVQLRRPMFDAGTLGTKGHVQVVLPFLSESYASTVDAVESSVPMCTIKSYPSTIEHAIEWALEVFKQRFTEMPESVKDFVEQRGATGGAREGAAVQQKPKIEEAAGEPDDEFSAFDQQKKRAEELEEENQSPAELFEDAPRCVGDVLKAALGLFVQLFSTSIQRLLSSFPADALTKEGLPFWAPPKRPPAPIAFNQADPLHLLFLESAAALFAEAYGIRRPSREEATAFLDNVLSLEEPRPITFGDEPVDLSSIRPVVFEKDSWHADFLYACANLRARNYRIKEQSRHFVRGVAGRIVPAIATTTAVVSGLCILELIKYALFGKVKEGEENVVTPEAHPCKNAFIDLAMPFIAQTDFIGAAQGEYTTASGTRKFTLWSRLEYADMPLGELLEALKAHLGRAVEMASVGSRMVYMAFTKKYDGNLPVLVSKLCGRRNGQLLQYVDVIPEDDEEMESVAVVF